MKLTPKDLKKIIEEEAAKFGDEKDVEDVDAEETDADEFAGSLEKKIDYVKALKVEEARLVKRLRKIRENKAKILKTL